MYLNKVDIVKSQVFEVVSLRVLRLVKCEVLGTEDREHGQRGVSEFLMNMLAKLQIYSGIMHHDIVYLCASYVQPF